jgi:integrase
VVDLYFVKRSLVERHGGLLPAAAAEAVALLDRHVIPVGMPVVMGESLRPVEPVSGWFRHLAHLGRDRETMRSYAYVVLRLAEFLAARGQDVVSATETDLVAYRRQRLEIQAAPIDPLATWDRESSTINSLFAWLVKAGHRGQQALRMPESYGSRLSAEMKVRHLRLEQYLFLRDVGLGGQLPDGRVDTGFRGGFPHRGRAAVELALMTGMRKREWSTTLLPELERGHGGSAVFTVQACAKYGRRREIYAPPGALDLVETYVMLERAEVVERSAHSLARRHRELFVVDEVDGRGRLCGELEGRRRVFELARMPEALRRITVRECAGGLESLAVFLGRGGLMLAASSWDRARFRAWDRMRSFVESGAAPVLPREPFRFHDLRHTFALRLLRYLTALLVEREAGRTDGREMVSLVEHVVMNPLLVVQRRLGHASPATTYCYLAYLDDPATYVRQAFEEWADADGASYSEIAIRLLEEERDAQAR